MTNWSSTSSSARCSQAIVMSYVVAGELQTWLGQYAFHLASSTARPRLDAERLLTCTTRYDMISHVHFLTCCHSQSQADYTPRGRGEKSSETGLSLVVEPTFHDWHKRCVKFSRACCRKEQPRHWPSHWRELGVRCRSVWNFAQGLKRLSFKIESL